MAIKSILVPFVGQDADRQTAAAAATIIRRFGASAHVLHVRSAEIEAQRLVGLGFSGEQFDDISGTVIHQADEREAAARTAFEGLQKSVPGAAVTLEVVEGLETDAVVDRGGAYDMLVAAHPNDDSAIVLRAITEAALFHTGRPVLLAASQPAPTIGSRVMIAWNRSPQASRAVAAAMPFLEGADAVTVLYVETGAKRGPGPEAIVRNLHHHGISADSKTIPPDYRTVAEAVVEEAGEMEADLIVSGAYSRSRLRERILGGVTNDLFSLSNIAVVMER